MVLFAEMAAPAANALSDPGSTTQEMFSSASNSSKALLSQSMTSSFRVL
jgi:hypothetical protein